MNITEEIKDYKNGFVDQIGRQWELYVINPYSLAYHRAYDSFKEKLDEQAKLDRLKVDLMLTGLSLFGGTVFTAAFSDTTTKALAGKVVIDHLNKSNNIRTLKIAGFLDNNPTAQFVIGALWSQGSGIISSKTKALFEPNSKNFPEVSAITQKPYEIDIALNQFRLNCQVKLFRVLDDLIKSSYSDRDKAVIFSWIKSSQFCNSPDNNQYPANLADKIELSFFMKYILDTDYIAVLQKRYPGKAPIPSSLKKRVPIEAIPGTKNYPEKHGPQGKVMYDDVGQIIVDRTNKLYKEHYKTSSLFIDSAYFGERMNAHILQKADRVLRDLSKIITPRIKQLRAASEAA